MKLEWKNPKIDGYPDPKKACFIQVSLSLQIAYWRNDVMAWDNPIYGWFPKFYDDEGEYTHEVKRWAYVPEALLRGENEI